MRNVRRLVVLLRVVWLSWSVQVMMALRILLIRLLL